MTATSPVKDIMIIGAGWSGLSTACFLVKNSYNISVYESSKQLGGRARGIQLDNISHSRVDNGQHLLIGAYHETLKLMQLISADINNSLLRQKLKLKMHNLNTDKLFLNTFNLPYPFHLFFGLLFCADLTLSQKLRIMHFSFKISSNTLLEKGDISVGELLVKYKQPNKLVKALWEPLCIATLNTPINKASAKIFINVLKKSLFGRKSESDFLFTTKNLSSIIPEPAASYLHKHNANIQLSSRATKIIVKNNSIESVVINGELIPIKNLVLAIPPYACAKLLSNIIELDDIVKQLLQFEYQPICTVYLQYPEDVTMNQVMIGVWDSTVQWLFDRKITNQNGLMAAIISAEGSHMDLDNKSLIEQVQSEIKQLFPDWPTPLYSKVIKEKRATFSCNVNISTIRPANKTPVTGLWLCGDYTNTDLPATIEGAIISGKLTATEITQTNII